MKNYLGLLILIVIVIAGVFVYKGLGFSSQPITGYSGLTSEYTALDTEIDYGLQTTLGGTYVDTVPIANQVTGLHAEMGQPQYYSSRLDWSDTVSQHIGNNNVTKTWEAHVVTMRLGASIYTRDGGWAAIEDVSFIITLEQNQYTVFQDAESSIAYVIEARTYAETQTTDSNLVKVFPTAGGARFTPVKTSNAAVPAWLQDAGYSGNLQYFQSIDIALIVNSMVPSSFFGLFRTDEHAQFYLEIDVLLFGEWILTTPWVDYDAGEKSLLDTILEMLTTFGIIISGFVGMVIIIYVAPKQWKILGPVIFIFALAWSLGWLDPIFEAFR